MQYSVTNMSTPLTAGSCRRSTSISCWTVDAGHDHGVPSGEAPIQAVPAVALVHASGSGDADVPVDVVPLDAGLAEPDLLAEGVPSSHALLQVAAGPDVSEGGMLRFIRTIRNTEMTLSRAAEQTGVLAASAGGGMRKLPNSLGRGGARVLRPMLARSPTWISPGFCEFGGGCPWPDHGSRA